MSSIDCAGTSCVEIEANHPDVSRASAARVGNIVQLLAAALAAASLAACAQSSVVSKNSGFLTPIRQASLERNRTASLAPERQVVSAKRHTPFARHDNAATAPMVSQGLASFYSEGARTASGEKFDAHELTAAHPTLPFGTKLRVTNVATGRSVTVRVNDRGPYVAGRVVDVSYSAANALGMVGKGVAKVKLDVVE
ncbi:MAG TPA: septal ring lytic transglycosylase RlpA family protein [Bradyrhizobium sp.]|jgi:rare lipoprotein A|uniref:septal ring lytic transglycosylase RlpA family protein n=1 Tax=Bradyrhizobium sp. TaxID=376 RepID=UPI002B807054|nr:septal ring lytic transglycosylase RlpA family protein [Bradyrhizobium sp.]HTB05057.1 septal ring lytic transglycosylase RlpA family protein [Bradyrhizobium sp.]